MEDIIRIDSISMFHKMLQIPPPKHPLISVVDLSNLKTLEPTPEYVGLKVASSFYSITLKHLEMGSLYYGRNKIDFQDGSLFFSYPEQIGELQNPVFKKYSYNWGLFFHSDLIQGTSLASKIAKYNFFKYSTNEALHLSEDEKESISNIVNSIKSELNQPEDKHTKQVLVTAIDFLLSHCNRFYERQFTTRVNVNNNVIDQITVFLTDYISSARNLEKGLPTVIQCAEHVNLSPNYLSDLLRKETGKTTQEHIHYHLLETAKDRLLGSNNSVKQIAHSLGFEQSHYFSSLFKKKIGVTPTKFRVENSKNKI